MSQQEMTQHTGGKRTRRGKRGGGNLPSSTTYSMLSAKASNIPLPIEVNDTRNLILKWGARNDYPYFLNYLFRNNPIHAGIVRAKKHFTVSAGITYEGSDQLAYDVFYNNKKSSPKDKNIQELVDDFSLDFEKSNMFCARIRFSFVGKKTYRKMDRIPFEQIRFELKKDEKCNLFLTGNIAVSENWLEANPKFEILKPFNRSDIHQTSCFVLFKEESGASLDSPQARELNVGNYPDPPYGGAITQIETGIQIGVHNNAEIHNGFALGTMIYLAGGQPKNDKDKKDLERDLGASATGPLQGGRSMVIYGNGQDEKPTVEALNGNDLPDRYLNVKKGSEESTIHGHQVVVPTLFGVKPEGSFNASELETGYAIMQSNYFEGRRKDLESVLNFIMNEIAEIDGEIVINTPVLQLEKQADDNSRVGNALNEMSPLVATKVLNAMTPNEVRALAKLAPIEGGDVLPAPQVFTTDDESKILKRLKENGVDRSEFEVVESFAIKDGIELSKEDIFERMKKSFTELSDLQAQALNLISKGESFDSIRKALDISGTDLARLYNRLAEINLIDKLGEITKRGKAQNALNQVEDMEIMYEYRLRDGLPELKGESREFCKTLVDLNRLYTREEINRISGIEGYNVFAYRGGWYHNPDTHKNEPGCRHEWSQVITFKN